MKNWNKAFNIIMEIKESYIEKFGEDTLEFKEWLIRLNDSKYNNIFDCLQTNQVGSSLLVRYGLADMQRGMWEDKDSIYRECRSLVVDLDKEAIIIAPFRKFFNLNEVEENMYENIVEEIKNAKTVEIANKLDGSMQSARWYNDKVFMCGSMAIDSNSSWRLEDGYEMLTLNHEKMIKENNNLTFIFEYISLKDAHVVIYDKKEQGMYLIGIRDVLTGKECNYQEIKEIANKYEVNMTKLEDKDLDELIELAKTEKSNEKEGWVINIDGRKIKIKCDDYVSLHRLLDKLSSVNVIIESIADEKYDDLLSKVPKTHRARVEDIADKIFKYKKGITEEINIAYDKAMSVSENRKEYMIYINKNNRKEIVSLLVSKYLNEEINPLKSRNRYKKASEIGVG